MPDISVTMPHEEALDLRAYLVEEYQIQRDASCNWRADGWPDLASLDDGDKAELDRIRARIAAIDVALDDNEPLHCRVCGCTEYDCSGCVERTGHACSWVEPDLCSACHLLLRMGFHPPEKIKGHWRHPEYGPLLGSQVADYVQVFIQ